MNSILHYIGSSQNFITDDACFYYKKTTSNISLKKYLFVKHALSTAGNILFRHMLTFIKAQMRKQRTMGVH